MSDMPSTATRRAATATLLLAASLLSGCSASDEETEYGLRKAILERQNQGLRELIVEAENGTLLPEDRFLIGIDEKVIGDALRLQLPMERPLGERFIVHLDSATVLLQDKFGFITLDGDIHRPETPDRRNSVRIHGGLGDIAVDSTTNRLSVKIAVDRIELRNVGLLDRVLGAGGKKFISEKGRDLLQDELPTLQVPVALAQNIRIPAIREGPIELDSLAVPLNLSVERVLAAGGKLWVTLHAEIGHVTGAEKGLGVSVKKKPRKPRTRGGS
jgi:hypothetical protein